MLVSLSNRPGVLRRKRRDARGVCAKRESHTGHREKGDICKPGIVASPETNPEVTLSLDFQPPQPGDSKSPVCGVLVWQCLSIFCAAVPECHSLGDGLL
jgi:hypothetical protein